MTFILTYKKKKKKNCLMDNFSIVLCRPTKVDLWANLEKVGQCSLYFDLTYSYAKSKLVQYMSSVFYALG